VAVAAFGHSIQGDKIHLMTAVLLFHAVLHCLLKGVFVFTAVLSVVYIINGLLLRYFL
jgi:hypothetical protein